MFELRLMCPEDRVETVSDALDALDALSVSVEDADAQTDAEQALFGEPGMPPPKDGWQRSRVIALFATQDDANETAALLKAQDFFENCEVLGVQAVPDQDWVRLTQSQFAPVEITPEFWIVPTWHEPPTAARQVIRLDPGLAFGTGTHPTTRMCLQWIAQNAPALQGQRALDYGCGSGILAIAAAKLGGKKIMACDTDADSVSIARENAVLNGVGDKIDFFDGSIGDGTPAYDLVCANLTADVILPLLDTLSEKTVESHRANILRKLGMRDRGYSAYCSSKGVGRIWPWRILGLGCGKGLADPQNPIGREHALAFGQDKQGVDFGCDQARANGCDPS